jgi:MYXO-CTERM domain-containing protein
VRIDWQSRATNYTQAVSRAVDSAVANGQAFITEYAGPSSVVGVSNISVYNPTWTEVPFVTMQPENVVDELTRQGFGSCFPSLCQFNHPLVLPLLQQYLPAPTGLDEATFYSQLRTYALRIDRLKWSGPGFSADFKSRIVDPGKHARDIMTRWPYLTRMFTTISPAEMTLDPTFHARADLSNQQEDNRSVFATRRTTCNGQSAMILPDQREVALSRSMQGWPVFSSEMPWAERIEEVPLTGPVLGLVDNKEKIDQQLLLWNQSQGWPPPGSSGTGGAGAASGNGGTTGAGASGASGASGRGGAGGASGRTGAAGGSFPADTDPARADGGCACGLASEADGEFWLAAGAMGLAWLRRRNRRKALVHPLP